MVSLACFKICFRPVATVLFFFISRSPFLCALSTSNIGSVSHPAGDRPSHPICETVLSVTGFSRRASFQEADFSRCEKSFCATMDSVRERQNPSIEFGFYVEQPAPQRLTHLTPATVHLRPTSRPTGFHFHI